MLDLFWRRQALPSIHFFHDEVPHADEFEAQGLVLNIPKVPSAMSPKEAKKRAVKGEGADKKDLTKMLNSLRYNSISAKGGEKKDAASAALEVYKGLGDPEQRKRFLT